MRKRKGEKKKKAKKKERGKRRKKNIDRERGKEEGRNEELERVVRMGRWKRTRSRFKCKVREGIRKSEERRGKERRAL